MGSLIKRNESVARRKGTLATAAGVGGVAAFVIINPIVGVIGLAGAAYLGYDWLRFRMKHGLRL